MGDLQQEIYAISDLQQEDAIRDLQRRFDAIMEENRLLDRLETALNKIRFSKIRPKCNLEEHFRTGPYFGYRRCRCFFQDKQKAKRRPPFPRHPPSPLRNVVSVDDFEAIEETEEESLKRRSKKRKREVEDLGEGATVPLPPTFDGSSVAYNVEPAQSSTGPFFSDPIMMGFSVGDSIDPTLSIDPLLLGPTMMDFDVGDSIDLTQSPIDPLLYGPTMEFGAVGGIDRQSWPLPSLLPGLMMDSDSIDSIEPAQSIESYEVDGSPGNVDESSALFSDNPFEEFMEDRMFRDGTDLIHSPFILAPDGG